MFHNITDDTINSFVLLANDFLITASAILLRNVGVPFCQGFLLLFRTKQLFPEKIFCFAYMCLLRGKVTKNNTIFQNNAIFRYEKECDKYAERMHQKHTNTETLGKIWLVPFILWLLNNVKNHNDKCLLRGGSRAAATSKMECFVIIVNGFQLVNFLFCNRLTTYLQLTKTHKSINTVLQFA